MEIEILEVAELGPGGGEELFADLDVRVHRAADVEEQQHLHPIAAFGYEVQIEPARILRCPFDRRIEIELFRHAFASETAQAPQRDLDVARVQLHRVVEIAERALVPDFHCAAAASAFLTDADALGVVAIGAERARSRGADPFRAALVARALLAEPGLQRFHQLVPAAERFDQGLFLVAQRAFDRLPDPFFGNLRPDVEHAFDPVKVRAEGEVEAVVQRLVLDEAGAREEIEVVDAVGDNVVLERVEKCQELAGRHRELGGFEVQEKVDEH